MADRRAEKEARKREREAAEAAEARAAAQVQRVRVVAVGVLAVVLVAGVVFLVLGGRGGEGDPAPPTADATLPAPKETDLDAAVQASGCTLASHPVEGREHEEREFTAADYETNPPTSGTHFPTWAEDGVYPAGETPPLGQLVHTLEHGRIDVQYKPGTPAETVQQLEAFVAEDEYHMVMFENTTDMATPVAFTAWGKSLTCDAVTDTTWDAARAFRKAYVDKGPEFIP